MEQPPVPLIDALTAALQNSPSPRAARHPSPAAATYPPILVLDDFLTGKATDRLTSWVVTQQDQFTSSHVRSPDSGKSVLDIRRRRSKMMFAPESLKNPFEHKLLSVIDYVRDTIGQDRCPIAAIDMQITASNDGGFFECHPDTKHPLLGGRQLTYVYFFNRMPKRFCGGHLRMFDTSLENGLPVCGPPLLDIEPVCNRVVFFPSYYYHEVEKVECPSRNFTDSRFTINGWFRSS